MGHQQSLVTYPDSQRYWFRGIEIVYYLWSITWKISSLCDSKEWSFSLRLRRSQRATVWVTKGERKHLSNGKSIKTFLDYCPVWNTLLGHVICDLSTSFPPLCTTLKHLMWDSGRTDLMYFFDKHKKRYRPCLQSQWLGWTRCRGWRTDSWPLQCGRPQHG